MFLAGPPETCRQALELIGSASPVIIDLTGSLEESPRARLRAPAVESEEDLPYDAIHVIAHPASIALALFYGRISPKYPIARAVIQVLEPASERGQRSITELQKQTVNLLSFKSMPKEVFDSQLGFNMLAAYGSEAPETLASFEQRIERDLATLLAKTGTGPMPSLAAIQAPVFHGYSMSIWMEFEQNPGIEVLRHVLSDSDVDVRGDDKTPPDNVGIAGQGGIAVGNVRVDRNNAKACWFWLVADNLRAAGRERGRGGEGVRLIRASSLVAALALASWGCGYHVSGSADLIPKTIQTICVPGIRQCNGQVPTHGSPAGSDLSEFITRTRYHIIADPEKADAVLHGA